VNRTIDWPLRYNGAKRSGKEADKGVVIVAGSSGFIGIAMIRRLATDYTVIGFDRFLPPHPPPDRERRPWGLAHVQPRRL
jgi:hypothetical protein